MSDRFVLLGLARVRSPWFVEVGRWCTSGSLPAQFLKCVSPDEVRARLASGRVHSALLVDAHPGNLDRDLFATATGRGCPVIVVADPELPIDLDELGATGQARPRVRSSRAPRLAGHLRAARARHRHAPDRSDAGAQRNSLVRTDGRGLRNRRHRAHPPSRSPPRKRLGNDPRHRGLVVLADLSLDADQALLHGTPDVVPGVPELVDAHRRGRPEPSEVQALTFDVPDRGYRVLLGLRRHREWAALRPTAVDAALLGLRRAFQVVVADVDADVEGDRECGVIEVEDRNLLARSTLAQADVVLVVAAPGMKGAHSLCTCGDRARRPRRGRWRHRPRREPRTSSAGRSGRVHRRARNARPATRVSADLPTRTCRHRCRPPRRDPAAGRRCAVRSPEQCDSPSIARPAPAAQDEPERVRPGGGSWTVQDAATP